MKYLMLIWETDDLHLTDEQAAAMDPDTDSWVARTEQRGVRIRGHQLHPADGARTVTVRSGRTIVTTGPFAEAGEHLAGFDLLDCKDLEEAIEVAAGHPMARHAAVEVRPMMEDRSVAR